MSKLKSRKFWMAVVSSVVVIANDGLDLGLPADAIYSIAGIVMAYIFGQGYVDGQAAAPVLVPLEASTTASTTNPAAQGSK